MTHHNDIRGATLIETLLAASLLVILVAGVAGLLLLAHRFAIQIEQATLADEAAAAVLEQHLARRWTFDVIGQPADDARWRVSPGHSLEEDIEGFHDHLDAAGRPVQESRDRAPAFVRRWAIVPVTHGANDARGVEACVFAWPAESGAAPLVCLASIRTRQP